MTPRPCHEIAALQLRLPAEGDPGSARADRVEGVHALAPLSFEQSFSALPIPPCHPPPSPSRCPLHFGEEYLEWCDDHDVRARFGAVGRHGSIAVEERFIRTLKEEGLAHDLVPLRHTAFCASLARLEDWYNEVRPHSSRGGATPDEVFHGRRPANRRRRFEPRARYPANGACAAPWAPPRAKIGARHELVATPFRWARHLAQIEIRRGD
jgi:hypothetical protein